MSLLLFAVCTVGALAPRQRLKEGTGGTKNEIFVPFHIFTLTFFMYMP